jgi:hypothetical protein
VDGLRFDSRKEAARWGELCLLRDAGVISGLRRQVRIPIRVKGVTVCRYVADAVYIEGGRRVVEDVKSPATRRLAVYRLKRRLLAAVYGIQIREV